MTYDKFIEELYYYISTDCSRSKVVEQDIKNNQRDDELI